MSERERDAWWEREWENECLVHTQNGVKSREVSDAQTGKIARGNDSSDTESEEEGERDEVSRKILESGGRDKVAYFFWQGECVCVSM